MKEKWKILCICMIFVANDAFSQFHATKLSCEPRVFTRIPVISVEVIPKNLAYKKQGFICRKEWKVESSLKVPLRFRLGNIDIVDRLEGKPNAVKIGPQ